MSEAPNISLEERLAATQRELAILKAAQAAREGTGFKAGAKRILAGVAAAFTSPEAVKAEKSLATLVLTRLAILVPTFAVLIEILVNALGGPSVTP